MQGWKKWSEWITQLTRWHTLSIVVLGMLWVVIVVLYSPTHNAPFQGDDFRYVRHLFFYLPDLLNGQGWDIWLSSFSGFGAWSYFRPAFQLSYLYDFLVWGLEPIGYHFTNLVLHWLTAFLVFLLSWLLTHRRVMALVASVFFAVMPIHVEAVSWFGARADGLVTFGYVLSVIFFVLFHRSRRARFLVFSMGAFIVALLAKESAVTLPLVLLTYDWLYHREVFGQILQGLKKHLSFWSVLLLYLVFRMILWNSTGAFPAPRSLSFPWDYLSQAYVLALVDPFLSDMTGGIRWALLALAGLVLFIYRSRRELWFAAVWLGITILPSLFSLDANVFDRYVYLPSVGLVIALASVVTNPFPRLANLSRGVAIALFLLIFFVYANGLYERNGAWARAAQITQLVIQQVRALHPTVPSDARLIFTNVPVLVGGRGMQAFGGKLHYALQLAYKNPQLEVLNLSQFPVLTDRLERTYFFEYNRRKITERADLPHLLTTRNRCLNSVQQAIVWNFQNGVQGWEPWNDLVGFSVRDGVLFTESVGSDPYMASPEIDIDTLTIANVEITMRVIADQPNIEGRVYWHASSRQDFEPDLFRAFTVKPDGEFHTYRVDISKGPLFIGDRLLRLRLDPVDTPAHIAIKTIRVNTVCWSERDNRCECIP